MMQIYVFVQSFGLFAFDILVRFEGIFFLVFFVPFTSVWFSGVFGDFGAKKKQS
jgi:hypothetical protein